TRFGRKHGCEPERYAGTQGKMHVTALPTNPAVSGTPRKLFAADAAMASSGMAAVVVLVICLVAMAGWVLRTQRNSVEFARRQQVETIGVLLSDNAARLLSTDDLSQLRGAISSAARNWDLTTCRVVIGQQIIADADPHQINLQSLPAK